jgi:cytochrome c
MKSVFTFLLALFFSTAAVADTIGEKDVQAMVDKAATFLKANGKDKLFSEANAKNPEWYKNAATYLLAYDLAGTCTLQPMNPKLVGVNMVDVPDVDGKLFRKEIVDGAKAKGQGWVDYKYKNPQTGKAEAKRLYYVKAGDSILVAGMSK